MLAKLFAVVACLFSTSSVVAAPSLPGFVTTRGQQFFLNGRPYYFAGTNSYWLQYTTNVADIQHILQRASAVGHKVIRTWGFHDVNATFIPPEEGGLPRYSISSAGPDAIIYNTWKDGKVTLNTGATGLQHFDTVVRLAERYDVKLIVTLTNNWADYGGMDVYTINLGGRFHDEFYWNRRVVSAYKDYVRAIVTRYRSSPAIFAWELANEPRCGADAARNLPRSPDRCSPAVITRWADEIATFIKSLDRNHLVTLGDEGNFNDPTNEDWAYNGADGIDFYANLRLRNFDFGTFHLYPDWWSKTIEWSNRYIRDHGRAQRIVGKPVVFEEYGWLSEKGREEIFGTPNNASRIDVVGHWQELSIRERLGGDMYWQFGLQTGLSTGSSHDDGFTIFLETRTESVPLIYNHVAEVRRRLP